MELKALQRITVAALEDVKAQDIQVFDTLGQTSEFDRVIVTTGTSNRHTRALAWSVVQKVKEAGGQVVSVEGADTGEWVLVDLGDIIVHVMVPPVRAYYALEEIWGAKPVRAKPAEKSATRTSKKASTKTPKKAPKKAPRKTSSKAPQKLAKPTAKRAAKKSTKKVVVQKKAPRKSALKSSARPTAEKAATRKAVTRARS